jgi:hypothetical protein
MIGKLCELAHESVLLYMRKALGKETGQALQLKKENHKQEFACLYKAEQRGVVIVLGDGT